MTTVPPDQLSTAEVLALARARWQIELLSKVWKAKDTSPIRAAPSLGGFSEVYAKLIAVLIQRWIIIVCCCKNPLRGLTKAARTIQKHAFHLACCVLDWIPSDLVRPQAPWRNALFWLSL